MSKKWIAVAALYFGLLTVCIVALYAVPSVKGMLEKTYIAEFGTLDVKDEVSAFVVRDEHVFVAGQSSSINRVTEEGELVKAESAVVELAPKEGDESEADSGSFEEIVRMLGSNVIVSNKGYTTESGYVCYSVDGAEAELSPDNMGRLTRADYDTLSSRRIKQTPKKSCKKGEPVFKIVTNGKWYLIYYTDRDNASRYREGSYANMDISGNSVRVQVRKVEELDEGARVTLECKSYFEGYLEARTLKTTVTLASAEGLILQKSSIVEHKGRQGVFVKNKIGEHIFTPIQLIASDGDKCVAYSDIYLDTEGNFVETIGTYDEIIAEPDEEDLASLNKKEDSIEDKENKPGDTKKENNEKDNTETENADQG